MINFLKNSYTKIKPTLVWLVGNLKKPQILGPVSIFLAFIVFAYAFFDVDLVVKQGPLANKLFGSQESRDQRRADKKLAQLEAAVLPQDGAVLPAVWGDLGKKLVDAGVIDSEKFEKIYATRGGLSEEERGLLYGTGNGQLKITSQNSGLWLNLLWALGLANKNEILEKGPMMDKKYGGDASKFASTGGWSLAKGPSTSSGQAMSHYSKHSLLALTPEQQEMVVRVSQGIYRPCCGNSTYFPDCNHGMAMLGLLELMASQGVNEQDMYKTALAVNSFWFPDTYLTIAKYLESKNISWNRADPKEILGIDYSSGSGYSRIRAEVEPVKLKSGGSCGI